MFKLEIGVNMHEWITTKYQFVSKVRMKSEWLSICLAVVIFATPIPSLAAGASGSVPSVVLAGEQGKYDLGYSMSVLEDKNREWSIEDVRSKKIGAMFAPLKKQVPSFGFSSSAYWYRVEVYNSYRRVFDGILEEEIAWIDSIDIYIAKPNGRYVIMRSGELLIGESRSAAEAREKHRSHLFDISFYPEEVKTLYIRVETKDTFVTPFTIWSVKAFAAADAWRAYYFGALFGAIAIMFLYNLVLYAFTRDDNYLYYVTYLFTGFLFAFSYNGFSRMLLWPGSPWFADTIVNVLSFAFQMMATLFTRKFLDTQTTMPRADKLLRGMVWMYLTMILIRGVGVAAHEMNYLAVLTLQMYMPVLAVIGFISFRSGNRAARFFLMAWLTSTAGMVVGASTVMGLISYSFWAMHAGEMGVMLDMALLAVALADRINILNREKHEAEQLARRTMEQARDTLEMKVAERTVALKRAKEKAEEATRLKDNFMSLISHDLRSPVGAISGLLSRVISLPVTEEDKKKDFTQRAQNSAERMLRMLDHLLNISRLKTGRLVPIKAIFDPKILAEELREDLLILATQKGVAIINDIPQGVSLLADRNLVNEALQNLLTNAIKFCRRGGVVTIFLSQADPVIIGVRDTGMGINYPIEDLFRPDVKTSTPGTAGERGVGLGLPYCRDIMEAHNGRIEATTTPGVGSEFLLTFPRRGRVIMLVDDQEAHRSMMKEAILTVGETDFVEASNGLEAMEILEMGAPDLIVTDVVMPEMGGVELLIKIREKPQMGNVPVIMATAHSSSEEKERGMREQAASLGVAHFITKPIQGQEFAQMVKSLGVLDQKRNKA
ncbi:MAG: response regulator [Nitrospinota bacterium]|nr:response regulator [Nitrospinota bacterium]